jgi:hypothetical protein
MYENLFPKLFDRMCRPFVLKIRPLPFLCWKCENREKVKSPYEHLHNYNWNNCVWKVSGIAPAPAANREWFKEKRRLVFSSAGVLDKL